MFTLTEIFTILTIHLIGDFILQTDKQAKGKSKNWGDLISHTLNYSCVWMIIGSILKATDTVYWDSGALSLFVLITFIAHTITDYFTSRLNSYLWNKGDVHNFFVSISIDQLLHYIQLFLTYYYLVKWKKR